VWQLTSAAIASAGSALVSSGHMPVYAVQVPASMIAATTRMHLDACMNAIPHGCHKAHVERSALRLVHACNAVRKWTQMQVADDNCRNTPPNSCLSFADVMPMSSYARYKGAANCSARFTYLCGHIVPYFCCKNCQTSILFSNESRLQRVPEVIQATAVKVSFSLCAANIAEHHTMLKEFVDRFNHIRTTP
jgi:hypothetical protein